MTIVAAAPRIDPAGRKFIIVRIAEATPGAVTSIGGEYRLDIASALTLISELAIAVKVLELGGDHAA